MDEFVFNLQIAGGEVLKTIPDNWFVIDAKFGIAENGSVFIENYNKELFLAENLAIILDKKQIYPKMTDVMDKIDTGVFISGPSKTADVESFLVFGAHSAMRVGIFFKD